MATDKRNIWGIILKAIIALATTIAGAIGMGGKTGG